MIVGKSVHNTGLISGKIIVKSNYSGQKVIISYKAHVLNGGLEYNCSQTKFKLDESDQVRPISIKNNFEVPIAITNVSLHRSAAPYFEVNQIYILCAFIIYIYIVLRDTFLYPSTYTY